ncbi:MAG: hypothetical protein HQL99_00600 [Magnetococcales bacterium]|nr:hypothetical protein [Magnetococcales bacterium]
MATLNAIKTCLQEAGSLSITEMAQRLQADPETLRERLAHWMRKGKVKMTTLPGSCRSSCTGCATGNREESYTWIHDAENHP